MGISRHPTEIQSPITGGGGNCINLKPYKGFKFFICIFRVRIYSSAVLFLYYYYFYLKCFKITYRNNRNTMSLIDHKIIFFTKLLDKCCTYVESEPHLSELQGGTFEHRTANSYLALGWTSKPGISGDKGKTRIPTYV